MGQTVVCAGEDAGGAAARLFSQASSTVREHRLAARLSQADLAALSLTSRGAVARIEHGSLTVRMGTFLAVLHVLGLQMEIEPADHEKAAHGQDSPDSLSGQSGRIADSPITETMRSGLARNLSYWARGQRRRLHMTQSEASDRSGMQRTSLARFEAGRRDLQMDTFAALMDALGCNAVIIPR